LLEVLPQCRAKARGDGEDDPGDVPGKQFPEMIRVALRQIMAEKSL
jgi:hypothetical protein